MPKGTQRIKGVEYVYEYDSAWIANKKYGTHTRNYIGKNVNGEFVPNKKYQLQLKLQEVTKKQSDSAAGEKSSRNFYGATYLFNAIGEKLGITQDLQQCFPDTWEQILSIAYYLILEDRNPLSRRQVVGEIKAVLDISERRTCRAIQQPRSTQRYQLLERNDEEPLTQRITTLVAKYGRYGYRRITAML